MKKVLGLDLGTNSIGWALTKLNFDEKQGEILGVGSRIIPMDGYVSTKSGKESKNPYSDFSSGNGLSKAKARTDFRGIRRLRERELLRRERLHRVLNIIGFLPEHYAVEIDFERHFGKFKNDSEPKLVYKNNAETDKAEFIFKKSFSEMLADFAIHQPQLLINKKGQPSLVPYDWTIYYLRKKALTKKIEKEELSWLLLNFNQKRGYFQLRGEDDGTTESKLKEFFPLLVIDVEATNIKKSTDETWYNVYLENGWIYKRSSRTPLEWKGKVKEFIVTTELDENGNVKKDKDGKEKRSFSAPKEEDWTLLKKKTELDIDKSNKTVGAYIYDTLLRNPNQKIKGKLIRVIERNFYKTELEQILEKQKEFHSELKDEKLYSACIQELYPNNEAHFKNIEKRGFIYLFINDIIFYQRQLKTKKSLISDCQYESRNYTDPKTKEKQKLKCIAKSHPLFQEFRLWQFIHNLKIFDKGKIVDGKELEVTRDFLKNEDEISKLFDWLNDRKEIDQKAFLRYCKLKDEDFRWNYVEDKTYPCNKMRNAILNKRDKKSEAILNQENEIKIWHLLYSVNTKVEIDIALKANENRKSNTKSMFDLLIENKYSIDEINALKTINIDNKDYGSFSEKAIKKILPLMRRGKYWQEENIPSEIKTRIRAITERLQTVEYNETKIENIADDDIPKQVLKSFAKTKDTNPLTGLNTYQACYAVYGRHSESGESMKWHKPLDIEEYLKEGFKQNALHNPVVEQVIKETLKVVADIWRHFGNCEENFFEEIHIELGRDMKNPASVRESMTKQVTENENTNMRIKALIAELKNDSTYENVRPYSPNQQEILKIFEDGVLKSNIEIPDDIVKITKGPQPTKSELIRYKLWLEQLYRSPYTGEIIPLSKLFTSAYEIEHIIPQSRFFDDSFSNKVICESEVNKIKDNCTGYEFICDNPGEIIELSFGKKVKVFTVDNYEKFVKEHYGKNKSKMKKLLLLDIPEEFINRQLNDTRYISKMVKNLLSNIVRENGEDATTSKNVIVSNGAITSTLKQDWGLNDVWNDLITPRFERLNNLTKSDNFGKYENKEGKQVFQTTVPLELSKGFSKKRIDHRHHALDALIIACATKNHINYLNNEYAKESQKDSRFDLKNKLCFKKYNDVARKNYKWTFSKPWETITADSKEKLQTTIVSFKQNLRVINKTVNKYKTWKDENGNLRRGIDGRLKKGFIKQTKGDNWAIRRPLHAETVKGIVNLSFDKKNINIASRFPLDESFSSKTIESITDTGIQKILFNHLKKHNTTNEKGEIIEHPELAFSHDGIDEMNKNIKELNDGKFHQPIFKVRIFEPQGNKFQVGHFGNKKDKYVKAEKGTNLFFAIYVDEKKNRSYKSISFEEVIERQKQGALEKIKPFNCSVPETNNGNKLLFHISPNDLVYVPTKDEIENPELIDLFLLSKQSYKELSEEQREKAKVQANRIYKFVDGSDTTANFVQCQTATTIFNITKKEQEKLRIKYPIQNEFGVGSPQSKNQNTIDGETQIKSVCWKLEVNRIGYIIKTIK